jgi:HAD superfamily hydrolase (TIGR01450 family)
MSQARFIELDRVSDAGLLPELDAARAFNLYEHARARLPQARFPASSEHASDLRALAGCFDVFVFDAFGVLNVGETPIAGARVCIEALRNVGKDCFVVTNAASYDVPAAIAKFRRLGFDFPNDRIVSSRMAAERQLTQYRDVQLWGVTAPPRFDPSELAVPCIVLGDDGEPYELADGFVFLSTADWSANRQRLLETAYRKRPRPVIVANPDIVAPREDGFSTEPGYYGHRLADIDSDCVAFHGKPFSSVYDIVRERCAAGIDPRRIAMIGDTLHTDVLGGAAQGWSTVLVTARGLMRSMDVDTCIARSGIVPDYIIPAI